jgi:hypothetical protein
MQIELGEALIVLIRWIHAMTAVLWIGAAFAILGVHASISVDGPLTESVNGAYRDLTDVAVPIFLLTGALLTFERFSRGVPASAYIGLLAAKLVLAFGMFHLGYSLRRSSLSDAPGKVRALCVAGAGVVLLATILKALSGGATS